MLFNSYIFVLMFLPICVIGYFLLNQCKWDSLSRIFLLGMSIWFYGWFNVKYLPIIVGSILVNYIVYKVLECNTEWLRRIALVIGLLFDFGLLFYFKYYDFFFANINAIFKSNFAMKNLALPLGISFFTFQQVSFIIDSYRREVPKYKFIDYALFVAFFPRLMQGPIVTHNEMIPQFVDKSRRKLNWDNLSKGMYAFALGLGKKVLIADTFGNAANWGFSNIEQLNSINAAIVMLSYTIQIYFDFSGYCDMALGVSKMLNFDLPINFNSPYKSLTIVEFWDRWHMTLTRFFTKYLYIPLGGSRKGKLRTYCNNLIVFLISGLWHGANWTFVLWGGLHGIFVVITKHFKSFFEKLHPVLNWLITFTFINVTWVLFRADSIESAYIFFKKLIAFNFGAIDANILSCFQLPELKLLFGQLLNLGGLSIYNECFLAIIMVIVFIMMLGGKNTQEKMEIFEPSLSKSMFVTVLLIWCVFSFASISTFLYIDF